MNDFATIKKESLARLTNLAETKFYELKKSKANLTNVLSKLNYWSDFFDKIVNEFTDSLIEESNKILNENNLLEQSKHDELKSFLTDKIKELIFKYRALGVE